MEIDNSASQAFRRCPWEYAESYENQLELKPSLRNEVGPLDIGKRVHELLEVYYKFIQFELSEEKLKLYYGDGWYEPSANEALENEAQVIMAAYKQYYPVEDFTVVDVERSFKVALPRVCLKCGQQIATYRDKDYEFYCIACDMRALEEEHIYTGKIDLCVRMPSGTLAIFDHKTEKRTSRNNAPQKWAARDQASLYLWAARAIYGEPIANFYVNVLRRPDAKNSPEFPERQKLERTPTQISTAVRDITLVANEITRYKEQFGDGQWPANRENCVGAFGQCPYYVPHLHGWSDEIRRVSYQAKTPYLELGGVQVIQPK